MRTNGLMTVGELSRRTGVPVKALREYTDWGLINTLGRSPANYRLFDSDALACVRWIRTMRGLGLTLAEIRDIVGGLADGSCEQQLGPRLAERLHAARARLDDRIAELQRVRRRIDEFESTHRDTLSGRTCEWAHAITSG
jgi:MerR family transcriptional regulator, copper efflux regulator